MLRGFIIALGFLTVFKVRVEPFPELRETGRAAWAFPLVGMVLGGCLVAAYWALAPRLPLAGVAVLLLVLWVVLTGGLHLDGWADCWDALGAAVSRERRLMILKDSRLGTFGALGLLFLLGLKAAVLAQPDLPLFLVFLTPAVGRAVMVVAPVGVEHTGSGMAAAFVSGLNRKVVLLAAWLGLGPVVFGGWPALVAALAALAAGLWFRRLALARLGMVNGDVLGGICELSETVFLFVATARW